MYINIRKLNVNERTCQICNINAVEDEHHFLFECIEFAYERENMYRMCTIQNNIFRQLTNTDKLQYLMNDGNQWRILGNYLMLIWQKRQNLIYR